jgi:hypothetical protein
MPGISLLDSLLDSISWILLIGSLKIQSIPNPNTMDGNSLPRLGNCFQLEAYNQHPNNGMVIEMSIESTGTNEESIRSPFSIAREMFALGDMIRFSIWWTSIFSLYLGATVVLYLAGLRNWSEDLFYGILTVGTIIWLAGALSIRGLLRSTRTLRAWRESYLSYAHVAAFEMSLREEGDLLTDVVRRLALVFPEIDDALREDPENAEYNGRIEGKKADHAFDAMVHTNTSIAFVRLYAGRPTPVEASEVKDLLDSVRDVAAKQDSDALDVVAVSESGFADEARRFAANRDNRVKVGFDTTRICLIASSQSGYSIVSA